MAADAEILDRVEPGKLGDALHRSGDEHAPTKAAAAGVEPLQAVNGREAGPGGVTCAHHGSLGFAQGIKCLANPQDATFQETALPSTPRANADGARSC